MMVKTFVIGLCLVLGASVASAQAKKPARKAKPAAKKPAAPPEPAPTPAPADAAPADGKLVGPSDGKPSAPTGTAPATPSAAPAAGPGAAPAAGPAAPSGPAPVAPSGAAPAGPSGPAPVAPSGAAPAGPSGPAPAVPAPPPEAGKPATGGARAKPAPMKTTEKAGANESLHKAAGNYKTVSKTEEECALAAFRQGNEQLNNGLFPQAVDRYHAALACWDHPAIHYNLALALINLDQPIGVYDELNQAVQYGAQPIGQDKFDHAREYLKLVAGQLADVEVSCEKPGAKVAVDGKDVFVAPGSYAAKVRVGKHTFFADKQGYNARITAPFIGPGETFRIELKLYTAEELTRYRRKWDRTWAPYTVIGAGALVGIVGGVLELSARSTFRDVASTVAKCNDSNVNAGCDVTAAGLQGMRDSGNTKRTTGMVMYGVAAGALATGAILAWINRPEAYQIRPEEIGESKPAGVALTPIVAPGLAGASLQGHF